MPNLALVRRPAQHARRLALLGASMPPAMGSVVRLGPRRRRHVPNVPGVLVRRRLGGLVRPEDPDQGGDQDPAGDGEDGPERGLGGRDRGRRAPGWSVCFFVWMPFRRLREPPSPGTGGLRPWSETAPGTFGLRRRRGDPRRPRCRLVTARATPCPSPVPPRPYGPGPAPGPEKPEFSPTR